MGREGDVGVDSRTVQGAEFLSRAAESVSSRAEHTHSKMEGRECPLRPKWRAWHYFLSR